MKILRTAQSSSLLPTPFKNRFQIQEEIVPLNFLGSAWRYQFSNFPAFVHFEINSVLPGYTRVPGTHSADVVEFKNIRNGVDGIWNTWREGATDSTRIALSTADCLAVTIVTVVQNEVWSTLFHAGWRGFTSGIHHNAWAERDKWLTTQDVDKPSALANTYAFISPAIFGSTYECGEDVSQALDSHLSSRLQTFDNETRLFYKSLWDGAIVGTSKVATSKVYPDLQLLMATELLEYFNLPSQNLSILRENTYGHEQLPSYRFRTQHNQDAKARLLTHLSVGV